MLKMNDKSFVYEIRIQGERKNPSPWDTKTRVVIKQVL